MKKFYAYSALCVALIGATSCGGNDKPEVVAPAEEPTAWSDVNAFDMNGVSQGSEVTNYGQNAQVVSKDIFSIDKESNQNYKSSHIIYQNGKPVYADNLKLDGSVEGHEIYTYDESGKLTEHLIETYNDGLKRIAPYSRYIYEYNANGDVTSVKEQKTIPSGWANVYEWTYGYDDQNRVNMRMDYTGDGKERKQSCQQTWRYVDGTDKVEQVDLYFYDLKTSRLKHDSKTQYEYNANGQVVKTLVIRHKSTTKREDVKSRQITYKLNAAGQLVSVLTQKWNNGEQSWYEVGNSYCDYDNAGQLLRSVDNKFAMNKKGQQILKTYSEVHTQGAPADHPNVAPAVPSYVVKPVINLEDKRLTSKEEE